MRFKIAGLKFGHVPGTELSATEQARAAGRAHPNHSGAFVIVDGDIIPIASSPQQRPPARQGVHQPPARQGAPQPPAPQAALQPPASPATRVRQPRLTQAAQPDPLGRNPDAQAGGHQAQGAMQSPALAPVPMASLVASPDPLGRVASGQPDAARPQADHPPLRDRLSPDDRHLYDALKLPVTRDTLPALTDADVVRAPTHLPVPGRTLIFSVETLGADGTPVSGVFKPLLRKERGWVAGHTGIPRDNPQTAMRNIATAAYAEKLGFNVIADTKVALLTTPPVAGRHPGGPTLGLLMERAEGSPASAADRSVFARPDVVREVTKLQLLDHLTGQGDRHAMNYFVHIDANDQAKVTGIDNDQCFGDKLTHPEGIRFEATEDRKGFRGTRLPPVVDFEMAIAITSLQPSDLRTMLSDKLSDSEVKAAIQRLEGVQRHIRRLETTGHVISEQAWGDPEPKQLLTADNSYAKRDHAPVF